jgi:hypothetical protein
LEQDLRSIGVLLGFLHLITVLQTQTGLACRQSSVELITGYTHFGCNKLSSGSAQQENDLGAGAILNA